MRNPTKAFYFTTAQESIIRTAISMYIANRQKNMEEADAENDPAVEFFRRQKDAATDVMRVMESPYEEEAV